MLHKVCLLKPVLLIYFVTLLLLKFERNKHNDANSKIERNSPEVHCMSMNRISLSNFVHQMENIEH